MHGTYIPVSDPQPLDQFCREKHHRFFLYSDRVYVCAGIKGASKDGIQHMA